MKCPTFSELLYSNINTGWPWSGSTLPEVADQVARTKCDRPRISIVMPCYNAESYIEEALRSVLLQDYPDLELIVMDGGSSDGTMDVVRRYAPWVAYCVSQKDRGQSHAINKGLERATGHYFNWFNADDVMCPGALLRLADALGADQRLVGVVGGVESFDDKGKNVLLKPVTGTRAQIGDWAAPVLLPQPGALFRTEFCRQVGGVNEKLHYVMDVDLFMRLSDCGPIGVVDSVIARFRCHEGSKTTSGELAGLVELVAAEFNLDMTDVARKMLQRRINGYIVSSIDHMSGTDLDRLVDKWSYRKLLDYVFRRILKSIRLRLPGAKTGLRRVEEARP